MGTSLTPEFWERFVLLLFAATGVTVVLAALLDALAQRVVRRRAPAPPEPTTPCRHPDAETTTETTTTDRRTPMNH